MNVYLAADFGRAEDVNGVARLLEATTRARIVSRWHRQATSADSGGWARRGPH